MLRGPLERHPPPDRDGNHEHGRDHEHAAAENQHGEPVVEHRHDERRGTERLESADKEFAPIRDDAQVIEVSVVEAELAACGDEQGLPHALLFEHYVHRAAAQPQPHRKQNRCQDEARLETDQDQGSERQAGSASCHGARIRATVSGPACAGSSSCSTSLRQTRARTG